MSMVLLRHMHTVYCLLGFWYMTAHQIKIMRSLRKVWQCLHTHKPFMFYYKAVRKLKAVNANPFPELGAEKYQPGIKFLDPTSVGRTFRSASSVILIQRNVPYGSMRCHTGRTMFIIDLLKQFHYFIWHGENVHSVSWKSFISEPRGVQKYYIPGWKKPKLKKIGNCMWYWYVIYWDGKSHEISYVA